MTDEPDARRAVVDRVTGDLAVLIVDPDGSEHHIPALALPAGAGEGSWLRVVGAGSRLRVVGRDADGEAAHRARTEERLARLRRTRGGGRFDRGR